MIEIGEGGEGEVGIDEGDFGIKNRKTGHAPPLTTRGSPTIEFTRGPFTSKTGHGQLETDHDCLMTRMSEGEFGMENRKSEGEFGREKRNSTEGEFGAENRNVSLKSEGGFRTQKVDTTLKSEPKIRVLPMTKNSGSALTGFVDDVALNDFGNKTVPRLGPHGNCPEKLGRRGNLPDLEIEALTDLQNLTKDLRERKATKSDDAPVPLSLWEAHLINDGAREWTKGEHRKLGQRAMCCARACYSGGRAGFGLRRRNYSWGQTGS
jgi:hypothetical protein